MAMLPFSREQFIAVFVDYNLGVWPAQWLGYALGAVALGAVLRPGPRADRLGAAALAAMWAWTGVAYHVRYFAAINPAAMGFGALFVLQGLLFAFSALARPRRLRFGMAPGFGGWLGATLLLYTLVLYPLIGLLAGDGYPALPMFGITPCPVTLFSLGLLLLTTAPVPRGLLAVPLLWSLVGGSAALLLGMAQDWPLLLSGSVAVLALVLRDRRRP